MSEPTGKIYSAELERGTISVTVTGGLVPEAPVFEFAERINPKRAFLFVSTVLGRHIPVRPSAMRATYRLLSSQIPEDLPGPVLFIGMAETAVGLGAGVHHQYVEDTHRADAVYICTTRYSLGTPLMCVFEEEHSHATSHLIHEPVDPKLADLVANARSLVLVDDEASTGNTFANLYASLPEKLRSQITDTVLVTLADWSEGATVAKMSGNVKIVSIVSGSYKWTPKEGLTTQAPVIPSFEKTSRQEVPLDISRDWARLGVSQHELKISARAADGGVTLVLGTGEHVWQPFLLAEKLEDEGADVFYSSVTRSPILVGHAIKHKFAFADNYGGSIPNFLYNIDPARYAKIILCSETAVEHVDPKLITALGNPVVVVEKENFPQ